MSSAISIPFNFYPSQSFLLYYAKLEVLFNLISVPFDSNITGLESVKVARLITV